MRLAPREPRKQLAAEAEIWSRPGGAQKTTTETPEGRYDSVKAISARKKRESSEFKGPCPTRVVHHPIRNERYNSASVLFFIDLGTKNSPIGFLPK
jgi:hypothetical protein